MAGSDRRYANMLWREGRELEHAAHDRLTSMANAIQVQLGYSWSESVRLADKHIYGDWRRPGDNGGPNA